MNRSLASLSSLSVLLTFLSIPAHAGSDSSDETVETLVRRGRELLRDRQVASALEAFEHASLQAGGTPEIRVWVVRAWISAGRLDEALHAVDELKAAGIPESDFDYLLGLALFEQAKQRVANSGGDAFAQALFEDAYRLLGNAVHARTDFNDAWMPLSEAAWLCTHLEEARAAVERAVELAPTGWEEHFLRGKIAFSQYTSARGASALDEAKGHATAALDSFVAAIELAGDPIDATARSWLAGAHAQCANLHVWEERLPDAANEWSRAMGLDPNQVDFSIAHQRLASEDFAQCLAEGTRLFEASGETNPFGLATLSWWTGRAGFDRARWTEAEESFRQAVELCPAFVNSWYFVFRSALEQQSFQEAVAALQTYWRLDRDGLVASLHFDPLGNVTRLDRLVAWCVGADANRSAPRNEDAAFLCELQARVQPDESRHWNNQGLFLREHGDALLRRSGPDGAHLDVLWERILDAYQRALDLDPTNPNYLNDTAVVLHYYLLRDFDRARELYEEAEHCAELRLAETERSEEELDLVWIALRDSRDNLGRLDRYLQSTAAGQTVHPLEVQ